MGPQELDDLQPVGFGGRTRRFGCFWHWVYLTARASRVSIWRRMLRGGLPLCEIKPAHPFEIYHDQGFEQER
jgi:hypothetical protein